MCGYILNSKLREANGEGEGARERGVEKKNNEGIILEN